MSPINDPCLQLAKKISPSMDIGPLSTPYLLAPVLALAQLVNVSAPGDEPDPSQPTPEDLRLFDPSLTNSNGVHLPSSEAPIKAVFA